MAIAMFTKALFILTIKGTHQKPKNSDEAHLPAIQRQGLGKRCSHSEITTARLKPLGLFTESSLNLEEENLIIRLLTHN